MIMHRRQHPAAKLIHGSEDGINQHTITYINIIVRATIMMIVMCHVNWTAKQFELHNAL